MANRILVAASTFPARDSDPIPAFVKDQLINLKELRPELELAVLAPHDYLSKTVSFTKHAAYDEYRFHYAWPYRLEQLAGRGIMPTLKARPLFYLLLPAFVIAETWALWRLTARLKPDLIYAHWFTPQGIAAGVVSKLTGAPFVFTSHSSDVMVLHKLPMIGPWLVRHFTTRARAATVVSRRSLEKLRTFFNDEQWPEVAEKVQVIPMGTYLKKTRPKTSKGAPNKALFVGRLAEKKGVQYLLPAFAEVRAKYPDVTLTIAGDGPWLERLQQQATGLEGVTFAGYVSGAAKEKLFNEAELILVPSIITAEGDAEGLPVVLMEGLAAGKLSIATNESGADDIITDGQDGWLIPQQDTAAIVAAWEKALKLDEKSRVDMQTAASQTAQQFDWPVVAAAHYEFLLK